MPPAVRRAALGGRRRGPTRHDTPPGTNRGPVGVNGRSAGPAERGAGFAAPTCRQPIAADPSTSGGVRWSSAGVTDVLISDQGAYEIRQASVTLGAGEITKFLRLEITTP